MGQTALRSDAQANRERLVEAARAVFSERGIEAEMKEVADRAGLGVGTIYRNFATKDDLVAAIIDDAVASVMAAMEDAAALSDPLAALRTILEIAFEKAESEGPLLRALMAGGYGPGKHDAIGPPARILSLIEDVVRRAIADGSVRAGLDPAFIGLFALSQVPTYIHLREMGEPAHVQHQITDLFFHAVLAADHA